MPRLYTSIIHSTCLWKLLTFHYFGSVKTSTPNLGAAMPSVVSLQWSAFSAEHSSAFIEL